MGLVPFNYLQFHDHFEKNLSRDDFEKVFDKFTTAEDDNLKILQNKRQKADELIGAIRFV